MIRRPVFVVHVRAEPGVNAIRSLRAWLKAGPRRFGLRCTYAAEQTEEATDKQTTMETTTSEQTQQETDIMSNLPSIPNNDGWGDAANEAGGHTIRGTLLKFADWRWTCGKEAAPLPNGTS